MSERQEIGWMLGWFIGLALLLILVGSLKAASGWHDGTGANAGSLVVWPASNVPPSSATNRFTMPGLYYQQTNCVYTNWFNLMTNWYEVVGGVTNDLGSPVSNRTTGGVCYRIPYTPTNQTYGVEFTNWIGVTLCGRVPTNRCLTITTNALNWTDRLTNFNASGGVPYATNISTRVKFASDDTDELFRWAWLRWRDATNPWQTTNIAALVYSSAGNPFPLYLMHRLADGTTNFFITDPTLTSLYVTPPSTTNPPFQYPYLPGTNMAVSVQDVERLDLYAALSERYQVIPGVKPLPANWYFGNDDKARLVDAKLRVLAIATNFAVKELADSNGNFTAYCSTPITNNSGTISYRALPMWGDSGNVETELCARLSLPGFSSFTNISGTATGIALYGSFFDSTPDRRFTAALPGQGHLVTQSWTFANLWTTNTNSSVLVTNQLPVQCNTGISIVNTNPADTGDSYCDPFAIFCDPYVPGVCEDALAQYATNEKLDFDGLWVTQSVFSVMHSLSNCVTSNCVAGVTNGLNFTNICTAADTNTGRLVTNVCAVNLKVYLRGGMRSNDVGPILLGYCTLPTNIILKLIDTLLFETNLTAAANAFSTSNSPAILTNYNVSAGWHDVDYGPDGVRKALNSLTWQSYTLTPYSSNFVQSGRWALSNTVTVADIGRWTVTNCIICQPSTGSENLGQASQFSKTNTSGNVYPYSVRANPDLIRIDVYRDIDVMDGNGGAPQWCTETVTNDVAFWPNCGPGTNGFAGGVMVGACAGYTVRTNTHTVTFLYSTNLCFLAGANSRDVNRVWVYTPAGSTASCDPNPLEVNSSAVSAARVSSSLVFPETMTNYAGARDLYVRSGPLAAIGGILDGYSSLLNTNRPTGITATNITQIAWEDCPSLVVCAGHPSLTNSFLTMYAWVIVAEWRLSPTPHFDMILVPCYRCNALVGDYVIDARPVETNFNVTTYALVPYWNGTEHNLGFDETNNLGYWQRAAINGSAGADISFPTFISTNIPTIGGQNREEVEAIDAAKVLIKWDADPTTGFRFHE